MKWLCKIRHKWQYTPTKKSLKVGQLITIRRRCLRCDKVEIQSLLDSSWYRAKPTKEELREINLKKLGL